MQLVATSVPPLVRRASRPDDLFARTGELLRSAENLIPHSSTEDADRLFLKVVHVHRRTRARLSDTIGSHAFAVWSPRDPGKRQPLALPVFDRVWVRLFMSRPGTRHTTLRAWPRDPVRPVRTNRTCRAEAAGWNSPPVVACGDRSR